MEIVNGILQLRSAKRKVKFEIWKLLEKKLDFLSFFFKPPLQQRPLQQQPQLQLRPKQKPPLKPQLWQQLLPEQSLKVPIKCNKN